jgi:hypothetical protein
MKCPWAKKIHQPSPGSGSFSRGIPVFAWRGQAIWQAIGRITKQIIGRQGRNGKPAFRLAISLAGAGANP